jgi:hypothetical protein
MLMQQDLFTDVDLHLTIDDLFHTVQAAKTKKVRRASTASMLAMESAESTA